MENNNLNLKQEMAIELILQGLNDSQVANQVGVSRQWVNNWRNHDEEFIKTLQHRRRIIQEIHTNQLMHLVEISLKIIEEELSKVDNKIKLKTALQIIKISGIQYYPKPNQGNTQDELIRKALIEALGEIEGDISIINQ